MIFLDTPGISLPKWLGARLCAKGLVFPDQADRALPIEPEKYPISESASADREWYAFVCEEERSLENRSFQPSLLGLTPLALRRAILRFINARCVTGYRLFRLVQELYSPQRFVLAAPRRIRSRFRDHGLQIDERASSIGWSLCRVVLLGHGLFSLLRNVGAALRDGNSPAEPDSPPVVWLGLTQGELRTGRGELNALDFVREKRVPLFRDGAPVYVAAPWVPRTERISDVQAFLCRDPIRSTRGRPLRARDLVDLVRDSLEAAGTMIRDFIREDGLFLLLAREYATLPRMRLWFRRARPRAIVLTNSMYASQPLWLACAGEFQCETSMLFYSTNCVPLYVKEDADPAPGDPAYRLLDCSRFEVWTEGQKRWLVSLGVPEENVDVAGIIIWGRYSAFGDRTKPSEQEHPGVRIAVFDVVPVTSASWLGRGIGEHYYSFERMSQLLLDVVELSEDIQNIRCEVFLKSKRPHDHTRDDRYWGIVDEFVNNGALSLYPATHTPIEAVAYADVVISAPFSSPSVIASEMGIPTCFYDPGAILRDQPISVSPEIPLINGRDELRRWLQDRVRAAADARMSPSNPAGRSDLRRGLQ